MKNELKHVFSYVMQTREFSKLAHGARYDININNDNGSITIFDEVGFPRYVITSVGNVFSNRFKLHKYDNSSATYIQTNSRKMHIDRYRKAINFTINAFEKRLKKYEDKNFI